MADIIPIIQIVVSVILIGLILIQERGSGGMGGLFGGGNDQAYQTRRGMEKTIFVLTILLVIAFAALALLNLVL